MKVLKARDKFLCNYEVLEFLREIKDKHGWSFDESENDRKKNRKRYTACGVGLEVMTRDLLSYLEKEPCAEIGSIEKLSELMKYLNNYELVKVEKLLIVNCLPRSMVHLCTLVEECDQRFDEETCNEITNKITELFPLQGDIEMKAQEEEEEDEVHDE